MWKCHIGDRGVQYHHKSRQDHGERNEPGVYFRPPFIGVCHGIASLPPPATSIFEIELNSSALTVTRKKPWCQFRKTRQYESEPDLRIGYPPEQGFGPASKSAKPYDLQIEYARKYNYGLNRRPVAPTPVAGSHTELRSRRDVPGGRTLTMFRVPRLTR